MNYKVILASTLIFASSAALAQQSSKEVSTSLNEVTIDIGGTDDHISCSLNGQVVAGSHFAYPHVRASIVGALKPGANKLNCKVLDDQDGTCYAYNYRVTVGYELAKELVKSCCSESCKTTNPVLDDDLIINLQ